MPSITSLSTLLGPGTSSRLILLADSVEQGSVQLFQEALWLALTRGKGPIVVMQSEGTLDRWCRPEELTQHASRLHVLELAYTTWFTRKAPQECRYASWASTHVDKALETLTSTHQQVHPTTILIDDLSRLLNTHPTRAFRTLRDLLAAPGIVDIVAAYHEDVLTPGSSSLPPIVTLASTHLRIHSVRAEEDRQRALQQGMGEEELGPPGIGLTSGTSTTEALLHTVMMKRSGKRQVEDAVVEYEMDGRIKGLVPSKDITQFQQPSSQALSSQDDSSTMTSAPEPSSVQASFNLGLTNEEREARDNTVLPYTQVTHESPSSSTGSDQATFYYQPDEADDFDDEDPDEDLDI
ncbi:MAG: Elongator complex protein 5 [Piptocephalis tieghemiana]|nr:MAG: Elongator complex protein 5 [Piptocephalis tieghemiana]